MGQVQRATDSSGKQYLTNVLSVFEFKGTGSNFVDFNDVGFTQYGSGYPKVGLEILAYLPENFEIVDAFITMYHTPRYITSIPSLGDSWCYSRKVKLYISQTITDRCVSGPASSEYIEIGLTYAEIVGAFGLNGFTATAPSTIPPTIPKNCTQRVDSTNLKYDLKTGIVNVLDILSDDTCASEIEEYTKTGQISAVLVVTRICEVK